MAKRLNWESRDEYSYLYSRLLCVDGVMLVCGRESHVLVLQD